MAIDYAANLGWHEGEQQMQTLLRVPPQENPTSQGLTPHGLRMLHISPLLALGTLDDAGRPWTTLLAGEPGFARFLGQSAIGIKTLVDPKHDPVIGLLIDGQRVGQTPYGSTDEPLMSGLAINLATRDRVKLSGKMVAGALKQLEEAEYGHHVSELQMAMRIEQSLGNCPKYLNKKDVVPAIPHPELILESLPLNESAAGLIAKADLFFISSSYNGNGMGTNHRGGPPGFVRVFVDDDTTHVVWPEYSGNRFYQTLGNLQTTPQAGLVFPDFDTGDVLYMTCTTEILVGKEAASLLPRSNLAIKASVDAVRFVRQGLSFRGYAGERSPYNPPVRFLTSERPTLDGQAANERTAYAKLIGKELLTPTIARLRFSISDPEAAGRWTPGQYVALAFEDDLGAGYSHMRDGDPKSLNDDYVRTFTVSAAMGQGLPYDEFEVTVRSVGEVTRFLLRQHVRSQLEVPLKGFGGSFTINQPADGTIAFVAGGIGITPLLAHLAHLDLSRVRLFWTINIRDIGLVMDTFERYAALVPSTRLFISGARDDMGLDAKTALTGLECSQAHIVTKRMEASDVQGDQSQSSRWYLCTGTALRQSLLTWLSDKLVEFEDFDY